MCGDERDQAVSQAGPGGGHRGVRWAPPGAPSPLRLTREEHRYFLPEDGRTHTRPPTSAEQTEAAPQMKDRDHVQHGKEAVRLGVLTRVSFAHLLRHEPPRPQKITSDQSSRHSFLSNLKYR